jgi:hypothetical protein
VVKASSDSVKSRLMASSSVLNLARKSILE